MSGNHIDRTGDTQAALVVKKCSHFNITNCTVLDCSPCGLLLEDVTFSRVSDCLIHESAPAAEELMSLKSHGGRDNMVVDNLLGNGHVIEELTAHTSGNHAEAD